MIVDSVKVADIGWMEDKSIAQVNIDQWLYKIWQSYLWLM